MEITATARRISRTAWVMAAVGTIIGQVHALARAQAHPNDFAESPLAAAWGAMSWRTASMTSGRSIGSNVNAIPPASRRDRSSIWLTRAIMRSPA